MLDLGDRSKRGRLFALLGVVCEQCQRSIYQSMKLSTDHRYCNDAIVIPLNGVRKSYMVISCLNASLAASSSPADQN